LDEHTLSKLLKNVYVTVFIQRESQEKNINCTNLSVGIDNYQAAQDATNYLIQKGHKNIAHITATRQDGRTRLKAFTETMQQAGLSVQSENYILDGQGTEQGGYNAMKDLLNNSLKENNLPTAIFCGNDRIAAGAYKATKEAGLSIPEDISMIAFDNLPWTDYLDPPLTTVHQPAKDMGEAAAYKILDALGELALDKLDSNSENSSPKTNDEIISYELIERQSVFDLRSVNHVS